VFFKNILTGRVQCTLEYVLKLDERTSVVEFDFVCPFIKVGYCLIDGKFNSIKFTILVDFDFVFVARIRTRQLVNLRENSFFIQRLLQFEERWLFINTRHFQFCRTLVLVVFCFFSLLPSEVELFKQCVTTQGETVASVIVETMR
jgi:hypothetical protein